MAEYKEVLINGNIILIEIIEKSAGVIEDDHGYYHNTHNCYAYIGYELDERLERTGRKIAGAGNNAYGECECADNCITLHDYLSRWDSDWQDDFRNEGLLPEK